jgi:hypothetical protein
MKKNELQSRKSRRKKSNDGFGSKNLFDFFDFAVKILISCRDDNENDFICAGPGRRLWLLSPGSVMLEMKNPGASFGVFRWIGNLFAVGSNTPPLGAVRIGNTNTKW